MLMSLKFKNAKQIRIAQQNSEKEIEDIYIKTIWLINTQLKKDKNF